MLDLVPIEIINQVFRYLGYRDLLNCSLVCRLFHSAVGQNASCQYTVDLAAAGMQDGPGGVLSHGERLGMLRKRESAWHTLQWTGSKDVEMSQGTLYELYGGVLVQSNQLGGNGLVFRRLPSHWRGIEEEVWSLDMAFILRDFTLDPGQDLLVLIAQPVLLPGAHEARIETRIHLWSLRTGEVHRLARTRVLVHDVDLRTANLTFMVQIHGDRVAVHFISHGDAPSELVVWNWKTGKKLLNTYGENLMAFGFLTKKLIMVGVFVDVASNLRQPRLCVVEVEDEEGERADLEEVGYVCAFLYPSCFSWVHPLSFLIRSDPRTGWGPDASVEVPFSLGGGPRLYVVTIWVMHEEEEITPIDLFVLSSTLLGHVEMARRGRREIEWDAWGPRGTRMMTEAPHSHVWVCYVYGTRFSSMTGGGETLEVWDFNQAGLRRARGREGAEVDAGERSVVKEGVFVEEVVTSLPYRVFRRRLEGNPAFTEAMCSEDNVILVDSRARRFRVLTF